MRPVPLRPARPVAASFLPEFLVSGGPASVTTGFRASFCLPSWLLAVLLCSFPLFSFLFFCFFFFFCLLVSSRLRVLVYTFLVCASDLFSFLLLSSSSSPFQFFLGSLLSGSCVCVSVCVCSVRGVFWFLCTHLHRNRHPPGGEHFCCGNTSHKVYPSTNSRSPPSGVSML